MPKLDKMITVYRNFKNRHVSGSGVYDRTGGSN